MFESKIYIFNRHIIIVWLTQKWKSEIFKEEKNAKHFILAYFINNFSVVAFIPRWRIFSLKVLFKHIKQTWKIHVLWNTFGEMDLTKDNIRPTNCYRKSSMTFKPLGQASYTLCIKDYMRYWIIYSFLWLFATCKLY